MLFVWVIFVLFPLATLLHELGHFITARSFRADNTRIILGIGPILFRVSNRFINIEVHALYFIRGYTIGVESNELPNLQKALISVNGPLINAVVGCYGWMYAENLPFESTNGQLIFLFSMVNIWIAAGNLVPFKLGSKKSDGFIALEMLMKYIKAITQKGAKS
ncbi:site-2 protease family protein [Alkalihalobacillus sp. AL-G]|uniref:site-2 protease family protein n=1 Tax=Alkalihalobacillus sp. AL-G TaxID=2926399 RepID=UPI00272DB4FF|nr:site-2 protease family protein [Alkalihalobacillus sp. AL-G]WLD95024.1 site-2 protease family protein [Alkalihalobacillus sp. AL-G]